MAVDRRAAVRIVSPWRSDDARSTPSEPPPVVAAIRGGGGGGGAGSDSSSNRAVAPAPAQWQGQPAPSATPPHLPNALGLDRPLLLQLRRVAIASILATDMARHPGTMDALLALGAPAPLQALPAEDLAAIYLHAADLSAPLCPDFAVAYEWSERCNAEFQRQAAAEAALGLPSLPFMTALGTAVERARQQLVFLDCIVIPLWNAIGAAFPEAAGLADALPQHRSRYAALAAGERVPEAEAVPWPPPLREP